MYRGDRLPCGQRLSLTPVRVARQRSHTPHSRTPTRQSAGRPSRPRLARDSCRRPCPTGHHWPWPLWLLSGSTFRATSRPSSVSRARYTSPMPPWPIRAVTSYGPRREPGLRAMLGTVRVGLFYRQLVYRVRTTAGQESRGRGRLQIGFQKRVRMLSDDPVDLRGHGGGQAGREPLKLMVMLLTPNSQVVPGFGFPRSSVRQTALSIRSLRERVGAQLEVHHLA